MEILACILSRILPVEFSRTRDGATAIPAPPGKSAIRIADPFVNLLYYTGEAVSSIALSNKRLIRPRTAIEIPLSRNRFPACSCEASLNSTGNGRE